MGERSGSLPVRFKAPDQYFLLSFPFPSFPKRSLFLSPRPPHNTKRPLQRREVYNYCGKMAIYFALLDLRVAILFLAVVRISYGQTIPPCKKNDCCQKARHQELDNSRRSTRSHYKSGQVPLCDKGLKAGWYRFTSFVGGEMPTTKVDENRCGTLHPIWLRTPTGTHPRPSTKAAPVTVMACVNINERNGGCFHSFNVGVKFCPDNYFVYYLVPMPSCSIAYCAGKISLKAANRSTMFESETSAVNYWPVGYSFNIHLASTSRAVSYRQKFLRS